MHPGTWTRTLAVVCAGLIGASAWAQEKPGDKGAPQPPQEIAPLVPPEKPLVKIGDPAPELKVHTWIKGEPVKGYVRGNIYVVELWATWCKPCRESIPRLTELQRAYKGKGVHVVGVDIWENTPPQTIADLPADASTERQNAAYLERVKTFVQEQSERMDYAVAFDGVEGATANWMFRLAQNGIPCVFIINGEGRMAWAGHPADAEKVVSELLAGSYDMGTATNRVAKDATKAKKQRELDARYEAAQKARDKKAMLDLIDEYVALDPQEFQPQIALKFRTLLVEMKDEKAAYAYAKSVSEGAAKDLFLQLNDMAWLIVDGEGVGHRDLDLALSLSQRADELTKHGNPNVMDTLARVYFEKGDVDKAVEVESAAIALSNDKNTDDAARRDMAAALKKYKGAKK